MPVEDAMQGYFEPEPEPENDTYKYSLTDTIDWFKERQTNCYLLASQKTGEDQAGWIEDARYFNSAVSALEELRTIKGWVSSRQCQKE